MLPAGHRLRRSADFSAVLRGRAGADGRHGAVRLGSPLLVMHLNTTDARAGQPPRVGFVVSKAVGGAVLRNRTKRRLRALMAQRVDRVPVGADVVIRANPVAAEASSAQLGVALDSLLDRGLPRLASRPGPHTAPRATQASS